MPPRPAPAALTFSRVWRHVDAQDRVLGKLAQQIATTLMGKHKPIFTPEVDSGDYVVVTNAKRVAVTGKKAEQKEYFSHSMYPGADKHVPYARMMERNPTKIIWRAVSGMLPKNKTRRRRLERLHIFPDEHHPFAANLLKDYTVPPSTPSSSTPSDTTGEIESIARTAGLPARRGQVLSAVKELRARERAVSGQV